MNGVSLSDCAGHDGSQRSTSKPLAAPSSWIMTVASSIAGWRKEPSFLFAITRTLNVALALCAGVAGRHVRVARLAGVAADGDAEVGRSRGVRDARADLADDVLGVGGEQVARLLVGDVAADLVDERLQAGDRGGRVAAVGRTPWPRPATRAAR